MKLFSVRAVLLFAGIFLACQFHVPAYGQSGGTTYYVAPNGSDSNPGSSAAPFRTIQRAADTVNPGDTVIVRDGTYSNPSASGVGSKFIILTRGGTASNWVTFRAERTWGAIIDGLNNTTAEGWAFAANYIRVQGFDVKGFSDDAFSNYPGGQFLQIVGNRIHDIGRYCTDTGIGRDGIFVGKSNITIEQNLIHDIGRFGPGENGCNPTTQTYQNNDHGIYVDGDFGGANNVTIRNNIFYNVKHGWSVHVYPSPVDNLSVVNNTFAFPNPWRTGHIIMAAAATNSRIENNIFYQPNTVAVNFYNRSGYSNLTIRNNIISSGTTGDAVPGGVTFSGNKENTNPMLANAAGLDFHLASGSPAVNAGLTLSLVPNDYDGTSRPQGPAHDIGAYESGSGSPAVPDLSIALSHSGSFTQGQVGATYTISVSNVGAGPTAGLITVRDTLPAGLVSTGLDGSGWTCVLGTLTCTRSDALNAGSAFPAITLTVDVSATAPSSVTNTANVSGGGQLNTANDSSSDVTSIAASSGGGGGGSTVTSGTYYVSPSGSDSNPGTSAAPFRSIQRAANVVNPGETVIVRDGTYSNAAAAGTGSKLITLSRGGTASSWVTFRAERTWGAVIDGLNNTTAEAFVFAANYIRVQGFEVRGFSDDAFSNYNGGQFIDIIGNHIHDIGRYCTDTGIGRDGIYLSSDNVTVEQNMIHDIGRYGPGENGCNPSTTTYQNNDHGIYLAGADNVVIRNNIFYRNQHGWSIHVYSAPVTNISILNNTFAFPNPWQPGHIILASPITNSQIRNNIFYQPNSTGFYVWNTTGYSNVSITHNITYQGTITDKTASGLSFSGNRDNTNPMLMNPSSYNFALAKGSPAVNAGMTVSMVPDDYAGVSRPQGVAHDIGAYESYDDPDVAPDLTVAVSHQGTLGQGVPATYNIAVSNIGTGPTTGQVTVNNTLSGGVTAVSLGGQGWNCVLSTLVCTRTDALAAGSNYPQITLIANIASGPPRWIIAGATVSGGGQQNTANDTSEDAVRVKRR